MSDFLTTRTKFFCTTGTAVNFAVSSAGSSSVTHKGDKVLTTGAKLSASGICPVLTAAAQGTPQPCKFKQTPWALFDMKSSADGKNLLSANSFCTCPIGGMIKVRAANAQGFQTV